MFIGPSFLFVMSALGQAGGGYAIGPMDIVHIDVYDKPDMSGDYAVSAGGTMSFPYCASVSVSSMSPLQAEDALRACLRDGVLVDPQIRLQVKEYRSRRVEIRGAVDKPGPYYLDGPTTLRSIVGRAGDVLIEHSSGVITLVRDATRTSVSLDQLDGEAGGIELQPGDVIVVEQGEVVLVGGQVSKPGPVTYTEGLTVTEALLRAGDATGIANLAASYVLRDGVKIEVNLRKIRKGRRSDVVLQAGDTLVIPESPI